MLRRNQGLIAMFCGVATLCLAAVPEAKACSPAGEEFAPSCSSLTVRRPADSVPLNVIDQIYLSQWEHDEYGNRSGSEEFPSAASIEVLRKDGDSYTSVAFDLAMEDNSVSSRRLVLTDPEPGSYLVTWLGETCLDTASPTGTGIVVDAFEIGEALAVPSALGTLSPSTPKRVETQLAYTDGGSCEPDYVDAVVVQLPISLELASDVIPWADLASLTVQVDGKPYYGGYDSSDIETGAVAFTIEALCSTADPDAVSTQLSEGEHRVTVSATLADGTQLTTEAVDVVLDCDSVGAESAASGCSLTAPSDAEGHRALLAMASSVALLAAYRRRRRSIAAR